MRKFRTVGFWETDVISVLSSKDTWLPNLEFIGSNFWFVAEAIDAGERAWENSGRKLNYRVETTDGDLLLVRYADLNYEIYSSAYDEYFDGIVHKLESFSYINEYFN